MDVAASFQFLVDALSRERYVIAPDLRGYGRSGWQSQGYWYADYIADLADLVAWCMTLARSGEPIAGTGADAEGSR